MSDLPPIGRDGWRTVGISSASPPAADVLPFVGAAMRDVPPHQYATGGAGRTTAFQMAVALGIAVAIIRRPAGSAEALAVYEDSWWVPLRMSPLRRSSPCSKRTNRWRPSNLGGSFSALEAWHADDRSQP